MTLKRPVTTGSCLSSKIWSSTWKPIAIGDRQLAHQQILEQVAVLRGGLPFAHCEVLEALADKLRPLEPEEELEFLYRDAMKAEGEANVYSAVVAFNNFLEKHPNDSKARKYKREIMQSLASRGYT